MRTVVKQNDRFATWTARTQRAHDPRASVLVDRPVLRTPQARVSFGYLCLPVRLDSIHGRRAIRESPLQGMNEIEYRCRGDHWSPADAGEYSDVPLCWV